MITKVEKDIQKSRSLKKMAILSLERLNNLHVEKYPSNSPTDYYDIIHKLLESYTLGIGIKIRGDGAHQELIDFVCITAHLTEKDRLFIQELRQ